MKKTYWLLGLLLLSSISSLAQQSVARIWNELQLNAIRIDLARPPVQARNLYHVSLAMYDAWAAYDNTATTYLLGKTINGVFYPFTGVPAPANIEEARKKAISFAAYRVLKNRYSISPNWYLTSYSLDSAMVSLGYNYNITSTNYSSGDPAELGNYIAEKVISMGMGDGANQANNYAGTGYVPANPSLLLYNSGNSTMIDPNRWQPLTFVTCIDQNGNPCGTATPSFICPHWGKVYPFSMPPSTATTYTRSGVNYPVYNDPGSPPLLSTTNVNNAASQFFKWGHSMVSAWSSHLNPNDTTMWDISPAGKGNIQNYPSSNSFAALQAFYDFNNGKTEMGNGYTNNPVTGLPYTPQLVKRGDYTRVVSQYWADGPTSETPPGHWFSLLNQVSDYPGFQKQIGGTGPVCANLEWDVKCYFILGAAMHDAAINCWGTKGWYDSPRPISMIRKLAAYGQCSSTSLPNYSPAGIALIPGYIEQVTLSDPAELRGTGNVNVNKIKIKAWKGFSSIVYDVTTPINAAGVGWILAENWMPYQRETFVTPPFAGYYSGHSTYSRAGAIVMTNVTGSPYFPGGLGEYVIPANSDFIGFETSPSIQIRLQWASYKDASDEASLSRIWGGIHPPFDDIPGRMAGELVGNQVYNKAITYFNNQVVSVELSMNQTNPVCVGNSVTFTASVTNPPPTVNYTWKRNGVVVSSGSNDTYSTTTFNNNDVFLCEITAAGYKVASNAVTVTTINCSPQAVNAKVLLQGYYLAGGIMQPVLYNQGIGSNGNLTDTATIELHATSYPYSLIGSRNAVLQTNGMLSTSITCPPGQYYLVIRHRNTIPTWSAVPVLVGTSTVYDFTVSNANAYGGNMVEVENGIWALFSGELAKDENIDLIDYSLLETDVNGFLNGYLATDLNGDGNVDLLDSPILEQNIEAFIYSIHP